MSDDDEANPTDRDEAELRALLHAAAATVPADPPDRIRSIVPLSAARRARRTWWAVGAAAAIVALVVGAAVLVSRSSGSAVVVDGDPSGTTTTIGSGERCDADAANVFVYFIPGATPEQVEVVRRALVADVGSDAVEFFDRTRSYEEFRRLFADQPDLIASVRPEDLPESVRATFPSTAAASEWLDADLPGILRVDASPCLIGSDPSGGVPPGGGDPAIETTTTQRP